MSGLMRCCSYPLTHESSFMVQFIWHLIRCTSTSEKKPPLPCKWSIISLYRLWNKRQWNEAFVVLYMKEFKSSKMSWNTTVVWLQCQRSCMDHGQDVLMHVKSLTYFTGQTVELKCLLQKKNLSMPNNKKHAPPVRNTGKKNQTNQSWWGNKHKKNLNNLS